MFGKETGKIIPIRITIPWGIGKSTRTPQDNSVAAGLYDVSTRILASHTFQVAPAPDQRLSTHVSSSKTPPGLCFRDVSDITQITLPVVQAAMEAIPVAGAPLKAAIGGLLTVLQLIDKRAQNTDDLSTLTRLLYDLSRHLLDAPAARIPREEERRRMLKCKLEGSAHKLSKMRSRTIVGSPSLAAEIAGCSNEILSYLSLYQVMLRARGDIFIQSFLTYSLSPSPSLSLVQFSSQMDIQAGMDHLIALGESQLTESQGVERILMILEAGQSLPVAMTSSCVILVDATEQEHNMLLDQCSSFDQLCAFLPGILTQCPPDKAEIQQWYIKRGQYDFVIDDSTNITQLTSGSNAWSTIQPGTKIVMRIITTEVVRRFSARHRCRCGTWNDVEVDDATLLDAFAHGCTITCRHCQRRFQIMGTKRDKVRSQRGETLQTRDDGPMVEANSLIRNFLVKQVLDVCGLLSSGVGQLLTLVLLVYG
ncbi:hypothetical protein F5J12DRAFT_970065 [Pisolithus orientalis]|uniref:uncharacterized protein n=1 Tax=Pisolithus orientalis TaxID=936130 RepID=UPI0022246F14|nr:uncharacterized protein F5J12DRAFT_970065 [Pisolithus orientalis]KAI6015204.1 hypothetical protein F5J12DRAFT_970065 [Pisolithus orientalis]